MLSNPSPASRAAETSSGNPAVEMAGLGNRLVALLGRKWSRRSFAAEMAKLVAQAVRANATAVLGYERRSGTLAFLADHGLSDEARAALAGGRGAWDIPLRGLQNRRISVIEAAHQNPFVPPALTNFSPRGLCIVSLPIYYDYEPVGVVLLLAGRARAFSDAQLQTLSQALRVCGRGLRERELPGARAVPASDAAGGAEAGAAEAPGDLAASSTDAAKRQVPSLRLVEDEVAVSAAEQPVSEAQRVEQELARAQTEMQRRSEAVRSLTAAMRAVRGERDRLAQQLTELEYLRNTESTNLRAQVGQLEERLLAAESERLRFQRSAEAHRVRAEESLHALQAERDGLVERVGALESVVSEAQGHLVSAHEERDSLAAHNELLTRQLQASRDEIEAFLATQAQARADLEADRERWRERFATTEAQAAQRLEEIAARQRDLDSVAQTREQLRAELTEAHAEVQRLTVVANDLRGRVTQVESERTDASAEVAHLRQTLEETHSGLLAREEELWNALAAKGADLQQRTAALEQLTIQRDTLAAAKEDLSSQLALVISESQERSALAGNLQQQLAAHAQALTERDEQLRALQAQLGRGASERQQAEQTLQQALASARTESESLRQNTAVLRAQLTEQQETLAQLRQDGKQAEHTVGLLQAEVASLRTTLEQQAATAATREEELASAVAEAHAELEALRQATADRAALARAADDLGSRAAGLEQVIASLREQVATTRAQLEATQSEHQHAQVAAEHERTQLHAELQRLHGEHDKLVEERGGWLAEATGQRETVARLRADLEQAELEQQRAMDEAHRFSDELETGRRQVDELQTQIAQQGARLEAATDKCRQLREAVRQGEAAAAAATAQTDELRQTVREAVQRLEQERLRHAAEIEGLIEESAAPLTVPTASLSEGTTEDTQESQSTTGEEVDFSPEQPLIIERSAPLAAAAEPPEVVDIPEPQTQSPRPASSMGDLVLLDEGASGEQACAALNGAGFEVTAMPLGDAAVDELARRKLKCIMLNLAAGAAAWRTLKLLRERMATRNTPILAYVMTPDSPMGFCFGRTDFALWPLEPGRLIERFGRLRPKLQRLLAITADVEGMGRLREPLARAKISTSIVLEAKQVLDFAAMVQPEAALLHLSPSCPSSARAILALRANESTRDLPLLILLDKAGVADEDTFFAQVSRQVLGKAGFRFSRLPEEIGRLIG